MIFLDNVVGSNWRIKLNPSRLKNTDATYCMSCPQLNDFHKFILHKFNSH